MNYFFHLVLVLSIILPVSVASASVNPWSEDFEASFDETNWTSAGTSVTEMLSLEYNHTADAGSSRSLLIQNVPGETHVSRFLNTGLPGNQAVLETWFYDEGATVTGFKVGVLQEVYNGETATTNTLTVGVSDALENENTEYILALDDITTPTGVIRTVGWHKVEFGMHTSNSLTVRFDNISLSQHDQTSLLIPSQIVTLTHPNDVGIDAQNRVWIDDVELYEGTLPETDVERWMDY